MVQWFYEMEVGRFLRWSDAIVSCTYSFSFFFMTDVSFYKAHSCVFGSSRVNEESVKLERQINEVIEMIL